MGTLQVPRDCFLISACEIGHTSHWGRMTYCPEGAVWKDKVAFDKPAMGSADRLRAQAPMARGRTKQRNAKRRNILIIISTIKSRLSETIVSSFVLSHLLFTTITISASWIIQTLLCWCSGTLAGLLRSYYYKSRLGRRISIFIYMKPHTYNSTKVE